MTRNRPDDTCNSGIPAETRPTCRNPLSLSYTTDQPCMRGADFRPGCRKIHPAWSATKFGARLAASGHGPAKRRVAEFPHCYQYGLDCDVESADNLPTREWLGPLVEVLLYVGSATARPGAPNVRATSCESLTLKPGSLKSVNTSSEVGKR